MMVLVAIAMLSACRERMPTNPGIAYYHGTANVCTATGPASCACRANPSLCHSNDPLPPIPRDSFAVRCFQDNQMRGSDVRCVGYFGAPRAFRVTDRNWRGKGFSFHTSDSIEVSADSTRFRWFGTAVAETDVSIRVLYRDTANHVHRATGKAAFTVTARPASDPPFRAPRTVYDTVKTGHFTDYPYRNAGLFQVAATWGITFTPLAGSGFLDATDAMFRQAVGTGPNAGVRYWKTWQTVTDSSISYIHPALTGGQGYPGATHFYEQQTGPEPAKCTQGGGIARTFSETVRHEGVTLAPDSHLGIMQALVQSESVSVKFERTYAADSVRLANMTQAIVDRLLMKNINQQTDFDRTDTKKIFGPLTPTTHNFGIVGCRIVIDTVYINAHPGQ